MKLSDIKKNVITTYHYTTIGGDELVFENERDCYKARENDVLQWYSRLISKEYLNCAKGVYLIKCKREMYEGKNFIVFNGMVVCDNVSLDADGKIDDSMEIYSLSKSVDSGLIMFHIVRFVSVFQTTSLIKILLMELLTVGTKVGSLVLMRKLLIFLSMPLMVVMRLRS